MNRWPLLIPCVGVIALAVYLAGSKTAPEGAGAVASTERAAPAPGAADKPASPPAAPSDPVLPEESQALLTISISPESRVKASAGDATPLLKQGAWTEFPITIENAARMTAPLIIESEQEMDGDGDTARDRWLKIELQPAGPLTGALHEERTLRLWSRDHGKRAAILHANAGQGTQDLGFRSDVLITFDIAPSDESSEAGR